MALAAGQTGHLTDHQEGVYQVDHGATAGTARPTLGSSSTAPNVVLWNGSVEPTNAQNGDWWFDSANSLVKVKEGGSFVASGSGTYVQGLAPSTAASRPAASADNAGAFHLTTDEAGGTLYRSNGSSWVQAAAGVTVERGTEWVGADRFLANVTGATEGTLVSSGASAWLLPDATNAGVASLLMPPQWWATFDVDLYWSNAGAGSGDVTWRARSAFITDGDTVAVPSGTSTDATAPAQNVAEVTTILSGVTLTAGELLQLFIQRVGGSGTDTLGNDAALLGVMLRQVS